jgi:cytidylate kinase
LKPRVITIDGTAASGKSTMGELLARDLGYIYFDTGVMYRVVTWAALDRGVPVADEDAVTELAESLSIEILPPTADDGRQYTVLADGMDVTWQIRTPEVNGNVSDVSTYAGVRITLVEQQRRAAADGGVVMVGRDIGTVVLPDAGLKVYLDATAEERARRRWRELVSQGQDAHYEVVLASVRRRDDIDSHRKVSPLQPAEDAVVIDTTGMNVREVLAALMGLVEARRCPEA